jgi:DNA-binding transcriptional ArsR family regulator
MNRMVSGVTIAEIGALVGDSARANMLAALMGGEALTAGELAWRAGVTAQTTSGHLAKLTESGLLALARQGRHRYYRLATPLVGRMLEAVMAVASLQSPPRYRPRSPIDDALRQARTCYDHLAGRLGVALADALIAKDYVVLVEDGGSITRRGERFLAKWGIDLAAAANQRRCFCRPCLDWSERRVHIAGALGARLAGRCFDLGWVQRRKDSRALNVTGRGAEGFGALLGIRLEPARAA